MSQTETTPTYIVVSPPPRKRRLPRGPGLVVALLLIGGAGVGTFASFSASTTNNSSVQTGALVLSDKVAAGTACLSSDTGVDTNSNTTTCDKAFDLSVKKPGDSGTQTLDLKNDGTIDGSKLRLYAASCTAGAATGTSYHGTGDPCTKVAFYVQEYPSATDRTNDTNPSHCWYGGGSATTCSVDYTKTLGAFAGTYSSFSNGVDLGAFNQAVTRYFKVYVELDPAAGNNMQGRAATIPLTWYLVQ